MFEPHAVDAFNVASAVLLVALGVFVLTVRPLRTANVALAVFALSFGIAWGVNYTASMFGTTGPDGTFEADAAVDVPAGIVFLCAAIVSGGALLLLASTFGEPRVPKPSRRILGLALLAGAAFHVLGAAAVNSGFTEAARQGRSILGTAYWVALLVLAMRYRHASGTDRRAIALMAMALSIYPATVRGTAVISALGPGGWTLWATVAGGFPVLLLAAIWLWHAGHAGGAERHRALRTALVPPAAALLAAGLALAVSTTFTGTWYTGTVRMVTVAVLAFAILRLQLLGLDARVRTALAASTLAVAFLGVLFAVSGIAQNWLGEESGTYLGGAAAGLLFLAITPLQRWAERLATRALPNDEAAHQAARGPLDIYRRQAELAWLDGAITRREGLMLQHLREALRLDPRETERIDLAMMNARPRRRKRAT